MSIVAVYVVSGLSVCAGALENLRFGSLAPLPPLLRSWNTTSTITSGTAKMAIVRPVRHCLRRRAAASSA